MSSGGLFALAVVAALQAQGAPSVQPRAEATVSGPTVRLGDLIDVQALSPEHRGRAARLAVASFPRGVQRMTLPYAALSHRISLLAPELRPSVEGWGAGAISVTRVTTPASPTLHQVAAARAIRDASKTGAARPLDNVATGQRLYVTARSGPVAVERQVRALQSARPGQSVFVQAEDGTVFAVPAPEAPS